MGRWIFAVAIALTCIITVTQTFEDDELEETMRALDNMYRLQRQMREEEQLEEMERSLKEKFDCKKEHEACRSIPACCGELVCYWADGFSIRKDGVCVECVKENRTCQRDSQCCSDLQCNKDDLYDINGSCQRYRREGECYRNGQCVTDCVKKWYEYKGTCT